MQETKSTTDFSKLLIRKTEKDIFASFKDAKEGECIICGKQTDHQRRRGIAGHLAFVCSWERHDGTDCLDVWHDRNYDLEDNREFNEYEDEGGSQKKRSMPTSVPDLSSMYIASYSPSQGCYDIERADISIGRNIQYMIKNKMSGVADYYPLGIFYSNEDASYFLDMIRKKIK